VRWAGAGGVLPQLRLGHRRLQAPGEAGARAAARAPPARVLARLQAAVGPLPLGSPESAASLRMLHLLLRSNSALSAVLCVPAPGTLVQVVHAGPSEGACKGRRLRLEPSPGVNVADSTDARRLRCALQGPHARGAGALPCAGDAGAARLRPVHVRLAGRGRGAGARRRRRCCHLAGPACSPGLAASGSARGALAPPHSVLSAYGLAIKVLCCS